MKRLLLTLVCVFAVAAPTAAQVEIVPSRTTARLNGTLATSTTSTCTTAVTTEEDLWTYALPANTLSADGQGVRITAWGDTAATANTKTIRFKFGATQTNTSASVIAAPNNRAWMVMVTVLRTGAATQRYLGDLRVEGVALDVKTATAAETLSGAVTIRVTGQNAVATANDICVRGVTVETIR